MENKKNGGWPAKVTGK